MAQKTQQAATAVQLKQVRERIERWRGSRRRCSPMPARLWDEATALARELGVYPVKRALGLNYESLKRRVGSGRPGRGRAEADASGFVELSGAQLLGLPVATGPMIEVSDGNGVRLTVRLASGSALDVARLVEAFRGRPA
jgi:hypothetical protein